MTTQPTSEQLAKWREEFESPYHPDDCVIIGFNNHYSNLNLEGVWQGYLRRCQENVTEIAGRDAEIAALKQGLYRAEQAIKDARKQALEDASAAFFGAYPNQGDNVRAFKELLND